MASRSTRPSIATLRKAGKLALLVGVSIALVAMVALGVPISRGLATGIRESTRCLGWENGTVVAVNDHYFHFDEVQEKRADELVRIHYMIGDGFMGPGDDWYTEAVKRDVTNPPLSPGDTVRFNDSGRDGEIVVRLDC